MGAAVPTNHISIPSVPIENQRIKGGGRTCWLDYLGIEIPEPLTKVVV